MRTTLIYGHRDLKTVPVIGFSALETGLSSSFRPLPANRLLGLKRAGDMPVKRKQERYAVAVSGESPLGVSHKAPPNRAPARLTKLPPAEVTGVAEMALPRQPAL